MNSISLYAACVPVFDRMLHNLAGILDKADAHAAARKIDPHVLLNMRLSPDMFALTRQVQIACDFAKGTTARLAGVDVPKYDDNETSFVDLQERIAKTQAFIRTFSAPQIDGNEARDISITIAGTPTVFKGLPYLVQFALPNFYFHLTTTYAILRHAGVPLGKRDFIGATT